jgi:hypothetical protein
MVAGDVEDRTTLEVPSHPFDTSGSGCDVAGQHDDVGVDLRDREGGVLEVQIAEYVKPHATPTGALNVPPSAPHLGTPPPATCTTSMAPKC